MSRTYYELLQVSSDADPEVIKAAFRAIMNRLGAHPDHGGDVSGAQQLVEAYKILADPVERKEYDRRLALAKKGVYGGARKPVRISEEENTPTLRSKRIMARVEGQPIVIRSTDGQSARGSLKDMSGSGARIAAALHLNTGDRVEVSVLHEAHPFAIGEVARVVKEGREFAVSWLKLQEENLDKGVLWDVQL